MKKYNFIIFAFFIFTVSIFPQNITVTEPDPGDIWYKGSTYDIKWTSSGCTDNSIKINIFKNSVVQSNFVEQLISNDTGSKSWTIPNRYATGNYIIRIKTADRECIGDSGIFRITGLIPSTINVTEPEEGVDWKKGSSHTIKWDTSGFTSRTVKITLHQYFPGSGISPAITSTIASNTSNDKIHLWTIPTSIPSGSYAVRIKATINLITGDSKIFKISSAPASLSTPRISTVQKMPSYKPDLYVKSLKVVHTTGSGPFRMYIYPVIGNKGGVAVKENFKVNIAVSALNFSTKQEQSPITFYYNYSSKLEPGKDTSNQTKYTLYGTGVPGKYTIYVTVDKDNKLKEHLLTRGNNSKTYIEFIKPTPEIRIWADVNTQVLFGIPFYIKVSLSNHGFGPSAPPFKLSIYKNTKRIQNISIPSINKGDIHIPNILPIIWDLEWGNLTFVVDKGDTFQENQEKNNVVSFVIYGYTPQAYPGEKIITRTGTPEVYIKFKSALNLK